jgi:peptidoglycan/LPS O-acetylase OafA/YrhL
VEYLTKTCTRIHADPHVGFAWLRLIGATTVVIDHSSPLLDSSRLTVFPAQWGVSPGYIALMAFFAMSGYQISDSWSRDPSWWRFAARRLLRLLPPLWVLLIVTVFVLGPLLTSWEQGDYWSHLQTWRYLVGNSVLFLLQHDLPGMFDTNPYPWSVNGSLWTLPMEAVGYLLVLVLGLLVAVGCRRFVILPVLVTMVVLDGMFQAKFGYNGDAGSFLSVPIGSLVSFLVPFLIGVLLHWCRDYVPLRPMIAVVLVAVWLCVHGMTLERFALALMASYGAVVLAYHWPKRLEATAPWVYGSYGMYIWAFPIQQMIIAAGVDNQWVLMSLAVPAAYLCGLASWRLVEMPTQRWRRFLRRRPAPLPHHGTVEGSSP